MQTRTQTFPNKYFNPEDVSDREAPVLLDIETDRFFSRCIRHFYDRLRLY